MNHYDKTGLTLKQKRQIRQVRTLSDEHQHEIDAAFDAADTVQGVDIPAMTPAPDAIDATKDAILTDSMVEPVIEQIRQANLGKLRLNIADQIRPDLGGLIKSEVLDAIKPPALELAITPRTVKFPILNLKAFTPFEFRTLAAQLGFGLQKPLMPELPSTALGDMRAPMLDQLGIARFDPKLNTPAITTLAAAYSWESVVPRIDLSAYSYVHGIANSVSSMVSDLAGRMAPVFDAVNGLSGMITSLLEDWRWLADVGHRVARSGLVAALDARQAAIKGETEGVEQFARKWLGIKRVTRDVLEAVVAALLDWSIEFADDTLGSLKKLVKRHRRGHKFLGDTQLHGRRVDSLHREIGQSMGEVVELGALVAAPDLDFGRHQYTDPRSIALLGSLTPDEQEIVFAMVSTTDKAITWAEAAQDCGFPPARGESVRRKVGRLKKRIDPETS